MTIIKRILILSGLLILIVTLGTPFLKQVEYWANDLLGTKYELDVQRNTINEIAQGDSKVIRIVPVNKEFSIVIPKINANSTIIPNVDPFNKDQYLLALRKGVAHALGSSFPGDREGGVYLFAHSADSFLSLDRYNAVFYLLGKLVPGDEIYIFYEGDQYKYIVDEVKIVSANSIKYIDVDNDSLTLQTCYPPGTTLKRLLVLARLSDN